MMTSLKDELREMIADVANKPAEEIADNLPLLDGLEIDSLALLDLMSAMEKRYQIRFTNEQIFAIVDLNSLAAAIQELQGQQTAEL